MNIPRFAENSAAGWTTSMAAPYVEYTGWDNVYNSLGYPLGPDCASSTSPPGTYDNAVVKRIVVHLPSGDTHELRMSDTPSTYSPTSPPPSKEGTYYAVDSSNIRYVQDSTAGTYKLMMPDGSYYTLQGTEQTYNMATIRKANRYTDRNGNYTTYNETYNSWTDTLGRTMAAPLGLTTPASPTSDTSPQVYSMSGMTGTYKFHWKYLKGSSSTESGLTDFNQSLQYKADRASADPFAMLRTSGFLFASKSSAWVHDAGAGLFNPIVLTAIELPTGQKYQFSYNIYGEMDKIVYPTGGVETFTYAVIPPLAGADPDNVSDQMNFGVVDRKVYKTSTDTTPYVWTYSSETGVTRTTNPDGTKYERFVHTGGAGAEYGFDTVLAGMVYKELTFASDSKLVAQKLTHWTKSTTERNPRVDNEESIVYD